MIELIGTNAGLVWNVLNEGGKMSFKAVKKATKIKAEKDMYAAFGWLAKEGKLAFEEIEGEIYHGIGRGELNIAGLPVYRDAVGGVGTPTSDEERTKIGLDTTHLLMIINGYSGLEGLEAAGKYAVGLLSKYVSAINMEAELVTAKDRTKISL